MRNAMMPKPKRLPKEFFDQFLHLQSTQLVVRVDEWGEPYIPGKRGRVTPYSRDGKIFCMYTDKPRILAHMVALPWVTLHQIADREGYVKFHVKDIEKARQFLRLKQQYHMSPQSLANLTNLYRFKRGENGWIKARKSTKRRRKKNQRQHLRQVQSEDFS